MCKKIDPTHIITRMVGGAVLAGALAGVSQELDAQDVIVRFVSESGWDGGFNGRIDIENTGNDTINGWELVYRDGPTISSLWNATWSVDGDWTTLENLSWNGSITPGQTRSIGFSGVGSLEENVLDATLNGVTVEVAYEGTSGGGGDDPQDPDFNNDGRVDGADLLVLLAGWNASEHDLTGDGVVNGADLTLLLGAWGPTGSGGNDTGPDTDRRIVSYFIEWGIYGRDYHPADMPLEKVTHINYAFADISADGMIAIGDPYAAIEKLYPGDSGDQPYAGTYNQLNNVLRAEFPHIKTLISVGGWTWSGRFSDVALTQASRSTFAASCIDFIREYNFDGVDLDWEYPVEGGLSSNTRRPEDGANYTLLLEELRAQLDTAGDEDGKAYLLTIAAPAGWDKMRHLEIQALSDVLDWINVMTYDFRGAWDMSSTAHHAAIYENPNDPIDGNDVAAKYNVNWSMQEYLAQGADPRKLVLGIPFYGRAWGGVADPLSNGGLYQPGTSVPPGTWDDWSSGATGVNDFFEIESFIASGNYVRYWDDVAKAPWLYSPSAHGGHFISYEDQESLGFKLDFIFEHDLGGVMSWEITSDRNQTLQDFMLDRLEAEAP